MSNSEYSGSGNYVYEKLTYSGDTLENQHLAVLFTDVHRNIKDSDGYTLLSPRRSYTCGHSGDDCGVCL